MEFRTRYNRGSFQCRHKPEGESKTKQSFKTDCDINVIMKRYTKTGILPGRDPSKMQYGDFSSVPDYQTALNMVDAVASEFKALPAKIRERCGNTPEGYLSFVLDPKNADEMAELGLMKPEAVERVASKRAKKKDPSPEGEGSEK